MQKRSKSRHGRLRNGRQKKGHRPASVNREMAMLKNMFTKPWNGENQGRIPQKIEILKV
jgi:hypothetical protein